MNWKKPEKDVVIFEPVALSNDEANQMSYEELASLKSETTSFKNIGRKKVDELRTEMTTLINRISQLKINIIKAEALLPVAEANLIIISNMMTIKESTYKEQKAKKEALERVAIAKAAYEKAMKEAGL